MTLALDYHHATFTPLSQLARLIGKALQRFARARRARWQAAIFRGMDKDTLRDIGFAADYIRDDWLDFADDHPSLVAASSVAKKPGGPR